jgi:hypothetical protein
MTEQQKFLDELRGLQRIVINDCYGGFSLSDRAIREYKKLAGIKEDDHGFYDRDIPRDDPYLVKIVKELGMSANGSAANLKIVEVPAGVDWIVSEYDGAEWVAEVHRTWS